MLTEDFGQKIMNVKNIKKFAFGLVVAATVSVTGFSFAQAQDGRWERNRRDNDQNERRDRRDQGRNDGYNGQVDRNGNIDRNRNGVDDRYENNRNSRVDRNGNIDRNRNGVDDRYENNRRYGRNDGYYGNGGYGNGGYNNGSYGGYGNSAEAQKGYRDGLDRGQEDLRDRRRADPNNSSHYRNGSREYKAGFRRGYTEGYNQYGRNRGW